MQFIYFLGRFHVLLVHLPIGFIIAVILLDWLSLKEKYRHFRSATSFLWGLATVAAIITVALGYMHFAEGGFKGWSAQYHRIFGTAVAILTGVVWLLHDRFPAFYKKTEIALTLLLLAVVGVAGHTGGNLTHGSTYLFEYAPARIRSIAGLQPPKARAIDLATADPFEDVVGPILRNRCSSCHGKDTQKNQLSLYTYQDVMKGGKSGPDIVPRDTAHSELFRRISLPKDDKDFMPKEDKPPLTDSEVRIIGWWIQSGAKTGTTLAKMDVPTDIKPLLAAVGNPPSPGLAGSGAAPASAPAPVAHPADPKLLAVLSGAGFSVRQVSFDNPHLIVSMVSPGETLTSAGLQALSSAGDQIDELDLQRAGVGDQQLTKLAQFSNLSHLRLEGNQISDGGVRSLADLKYLNYLNLYANKKVTDASVSILAQMAALEKVYLWDTGVTDHGAKALRKKRPTLVVDFGESIGLPQSQTSSMRSPQLGPEPVR
jgi:uncharacterized membrane protein